MDMIKRRKVASSSIGYVFLFLIMMLLVIITMYMLQVAKLMTHQHHVDDSLTDSVLASLVADDVYYFETYETTGTPVIRFRNVDESYNIFTDCIRDAVATTQDYYYNFMIDVFICYEVEDGEVTITTFNVSGGRSESHGALGDVKTPTGETVKETSAYGKVTFDLQSLIGGEPIGKSRDLYCTLEINSEESYEEAK